ncbi:hypothetical protein ACCO45_003335 [Purpureocillium lilacinum]|uniref:Uncharacterized protein n=1 Tax=Purpureocillium lilacinum TaxID=33203 RepID=A0ACC4E0J6_PURLI
MILLRSQHGDRTNLAQRPSGSRDFNYGRTLLGAALDMTPFSRFVCSSELYSHAGSTTNRRALAADARHHHDAKAEIASSSATPTMTTATTTTTTATATRRIEPRGEASILALALAESPEEEERVLPDLLREMQEAEMQARRLKTTLKRSPRAKGPSSGAASAGT